MPEERRRAARFETSLRLEIAEVLEHPRLVRANLSASGVFVEIDQDPGQLGMVRALQLTTEDRSVSVNLMGQVARIVSYDDLAQGRVIAGAAFEFLVQADSQRDAIERLLRAVADVRILHSPQAGIACRIDARLADRPGSATGAVVTRMALREIAIETTSPVGVGEQVRVEIRLPSQRTIDLSGRAMSSHRIKGDRYQVEVHLDSDQAPPAPERAAEKAAIDAGLDGVLSEVTSWREREHRQRSAHLSGELSQVPLTSLLSFLEMERVSGILEIDRDGQLARIFVRDGRLVDLEPRPESPAPWLESALQWKHGAFEFRFEKVDRSDTIQMPTSVLLVELARSQDETLRKR